MVINLPEGDSEGRLGTKVDSNKSVSKIPLFINDLMNNNLIMVTLWDCQTSRFRIVLFISTKTTVFLYCFSIIIIKINK